MKIGISNIALKGYSLSEALEFIESLPIAGLEIAPTLLWEDPCASSKRERKRVKGLINRHDIDVIGLQSLLYGRPDLHLFDSLKKRNRCSEYLKRMIELCADLGGSILVFGASKNRQRSLLNFDAAVSVAASFFIKIAEFAEGAGVCICIEPLSSQYGCDFVTTADEGAYFVKIVNHPSFRLILDTGSMSLNGESCPNMISKYVDILAHMHINDPHLAAPGVKGVDHFAIANVLKEIAYTRWLTLEFLQDNSSVDEDIAYALMCYDHWGNTD